MSARGRRPGDSGTRQAILAAARRSFAAAGYDGATMRGIAREAGVDQALVHHFYGTKEHLFVTAVGFPALPSELAGQAIAADRSRMGEVLLRLLLEVWDSPESRDQITALLRSALASEPAMEMLRQFMTSTVLQAVARELGDEDAALRTSLVFGQVIGLALARYVLRIPPLATAEREQVVRAVAPTLQRYLTGEIDRDDPRARRPPPVAGDGRR